MNLVKCWLLNYGVMVLAAVVGVGEYISDNKRKNLISSHWHRRDIYKHLLSELRKQ